MLPGTAQDMARRLGVPFRDDLYRGTSEAARQYQTMLAREYWKQAQEATGGDIRQSLMYYYGGPNRSLWGPNTHAYVDNVLRRVGQ